MCDAADVIFGINIPGFLDYRSDVVVSGNVEFWNHGSGGPPEGSLGRVVVPPTTVSTPRGSLGNQPKISFSYLDYGLELDPDIVVSGFGWIMDWDSRILRPIFGFFLDYGAFSIPRT